MSYLYHKRHNSLKYLPYLLDYEGCCYMYPYVAATAAIAFSISLVIRGQVIAAAARDIDRARSFSEQLNIPRYYDDYKKLAKDPEVGK